VDSDGDEEDGDEREVEDGVDEDGDAAGVHGAEAHDAAVRGQLEQQPRREQHEQHRRDNHGAPVRHPSELACRRCVLCLSGGGRKKQVDVAFY
jgi:hypothetical protein